MMQWQTEFSILINKYIKRRFIKGLSIAAFIFYASMGMVIVLGTNNTSQSSFTDSNHRYFLLFGSGLFWITAFFVFVVYTTKYIGNYKINNKQITSSVKPVKERKALRAILDFINTATFTNNPANFSLNSVSRKGNTTIVWRKARKVVVLKKHQTVLIKGELGQKMTVFYSSDNENEICNIIKLVYPNVMMVD